MAKPIRQFMQREGGINVGEETGAWVDLGGSMANDMRALEGQVPNNPMNVASFSGGESSFNRQNPYGDGHQGVMPTSPTLTRPNQWYGRRSKDIPGVDPNVELGTAGPGWALKETPGLGDVSGMDGIRLGEWKNGEMVKKKSRSRRGTSFGSRGSRNAPPPEEEA